MTHVLSSMIASALLLASYGSCTLTKGHSGSVAETSPNTREPISENTKPKTQEPLIQQKFQELYSQKLASSPKGSQGWAMFSDSPMGHWPQFWIIEDSVTTEAQACRIKQGQTECEVKALSSKSWGSHDCRKFLSGLTSLADIQPAAFDAQTSQARRDESLSGTVASKWSATFSVDHRSLPEQHQTLQTCLSQLFQ